MRYSSVAVPLALAARAAAVESDVWAFGNGFYTGPPTNAHITRATWSLVPPDVPSNYTVNNTDDEVWVSLWIGLSSTAGDYDADLYQPLLNWSPDNESQGCPAPDDEWCVAASTYTPDGQNGQAYVTVPADTQVDFEVYVENDKVYQVVTMNGKTVSKESDALDNPLLYLYSGDECYTGSGDCGTLQSYSWNNLTIHLSAADENFGDTLSLYSGSSSNGLTTSDKGKTWHTDAIKISKDTFATVSDY
ncbi:hypothetical protein ABZX51_009831 [Aspergillus tubingensis]|uniref:Concanavalin A-like lectin/glucanase n=4 Tax=Aspergillus subgen. Circumdati TaxID=2720871 RepID=A0A1L9NI16_ASPTC|nr:hypothetical protein BO87DRAFT_306143 [Aspergillus neoniger CBS 115656]XP_025539394.1 hypothetical protein BO79DRAFT_265838 [Aspergillus costaricaensis CBS 115574]OJI88863.1 hypothetical protein ASPTUDRAFT_60670 [Aspergillus tubingensis CBS 134.48]GAQ44012.1 similar to An13g03140 [Aspergillus niger]GLA60872.1 hypothetical protein AtubIFM54640_001370 [Aspergillus tubingensis]PYH35370.1 hypothetical protein BO87DRAFT_306143 [Aspergillus neoniger CBS 115656]RAK88559.1 hypothetical protein BO7